MIPKPPASLRDPGRALWRSVLDGFELDAGELHLLELACQARDDAARAREDVARDGVTVAGRYGVRQHPAVLIARQAEASCSRLLGQLGLVNRSDDAPARHSSTPGPKPRARR